MKTIAFSLLLLSSYDTTFANQKSNNTSFGSDQSSETVGTMQINEELSLNVNRSFELPIALTTSPLNDDKVIADTYRGIRRGFLTARESFLKKCEREALEVLTPILQNSESSLSKYIKKIGEGGSKFSWIHVNHHIDLYESKDLSISKPLAHRVGSTKKGETFGYALVLKIGYVRNEENKPSLHCEYPTADQINRASEDCLEKLPDDLKCLH